MNKHLVKLAWMMIAVWVTLPTVAFAQANDAKGDDNAKPAKKAKAKTGKKAAKAEAEAKAAEASEKLAELEAAQAKLSTELEAMREKVAAAEAARAEDNHQETIATLQQEVATLNQKLDEQAKLSAESEKAMKDELAALAPSKGFKINGPGDSYLKIGGLLQARLEGTKDRAPSGENWDFDTYLRRMRLMVFGQLNKWVNFFIETDNPNFGKDGNWGGPTFIQDAYLELNLHEAFQIDMGMLLLPFSHHGMQGATSLMSMDYHSGLIKYPDGGHKVWRDAGVMLRGLFARKHIEYRLGLFNGVHGDGLDPRNPDDLPRLTGRLTFNVFDAEGGGGPGGMFYDGLYIKKDGLHVVSTKRVLSFGASVDWQPGLNVEIEDPALRASPDEAYTVEESKDYVATAWDVFWDIPLGARKIMSLNGQANFYYYYHGDRTSDVDAAGRPTRFAYYNVAGNSASYTGVGMSSELGFRYSWLQPLFAVDFFKSTDADLTVGNQPIDDYCDALGMSNCSESQMGDYLAMHGGFNVYLFGHATTLKLQAGATNKNGSPDWTPSVKFQTQLLF